MQVTPSYSISKGTEKEIERVLSQEPCTLSSWLWENELIIDLKEGRTG